MHSGKFILDLNKIFFDAQKPLPFHFWLILAGFCVNSHIHKYILGGDFNPQIYVSAGIPMIFPIIYIHHVFPILPMLISTYCQGKTFSWILLTNFFSGIFICPKYITLP